MNQITSSLYFGELSAISAAICWSIAVIIFRSASKELSPYLIVALKNTIALFLFIISFLIFDIPLWYDKLIFSDYIKIIISGILGMGFADILFIYALSKIIERENYKAEKNWAEFYSSLIPGILILLLILGDAIF